MGRYSQAEEFFGISRKDFLDQRHRRFGTANPDPMDVPFWKAMIRTRARAWQAGEAFKVDPIPNPPNPIWSFDRYGMSSTALEDGTLVFIGGEHEDGYDPNFCIYNDVIVQDADGNIQIYGYPKHDFPPTDFHTATYLERGTYGEEILIIGGLGYEEDRIPGITNVYALSLQSFLIREVKTTGENPGWIWKHQALLTPFGNAVIVFGGNTLGADDGIVENREVHRLNLYSMHWDRVTDRPIGEMLR